ncbi:hypothetical protein FBEOM_13123 [Fusarium beomiforme]|uniref:Uncharacterized protein n=1 Tax=Fusarium beomiforme TaxID=44412 RepID=A0A9P5A7W4_9HYPO|nr:hypothetical protein FBEOM_13123 [Fusarium beomiforme]
MPLKFAPIFRSECIVNTTQTFPGPSSTYNSQVVDFDDPIFPFSALQSDNDGLVHCPRVFKMMLSPLCLAALQGSDDVIKHLLLFEIVDKQMDLDMALFLANRQEKVQTAHLLLGYGANPGQKSFSNGLHGAAWRGLKSQISEYIKKHDTNPDVPDGSSATPVIYAIFGDQEETAAWSTIELLFRLGASPYRTFGDQSWCYADIARKLEKWYLAEMLAQSAPQSPTEVNSSRGSSCTIGEDSSFQPNNKQPKDDSEVNRGVKRARGS